MIGYTTTAAYEGITKDRCGIHVTITPRRSKSSPLLVYVLKSVYALPHADSKGNASCSHASDDAILLTLNQLAARIREQQDIAAELGLPD